MKFRKGDIVITMEAWQGFVGRCPRYATNVAAEQMGIVQSRGLSKEKTDSTPREWHYRVVFPPSMKVIHVPEMILNKIGTIDG